MKTPRVSHITIGIIAGCLALLSYVALAQQRPQKTQGPQRQHVAPSRPGTLELVDPGREYVPGELLVKFKGTPPPGILAVVGARRLKTFPRTEVEHWRLGPGMDVDEALKVLRGPAFAGVVEYAEPNYIVHAHNFPNDPLRSELWGMHNVGQTGGTPRADIDALAAWQLQTDSSTVVVGVIDTGIDYTHEDLAANIWINTAELEGDPGVDEDLNGYVDDVRGWDFFNNDNDPMDDNGHGTHTAGTIGAIGNNGIGVAGVAWNVTLMPLKFLGANGSGTTADAIEAVEYAAWFGVPITNNSWGGGRKSKALENAIKASGSLFVASAGNSRSSRVQYPAGYNLDNILSVAATDDQDGLASFSSYGSNWVDLGAPGVDTLSSTPNNTYGLKSGTSMAAPHVAGTAALVLAQNSALNPTELKAQILDNVEPLSSLQGITVSGGRLNARGAVGADELPPDTTPPAAVADLAADTATFSSITLTWTASGDDDITGTAYAYDLRYSTIEIINEEDWASATSAKGEPLPSPAGSLETFVLDSLQADTTYFAAVKVMDEFGNVSAISNVANETTLTPPAGAWEVHVVESGGGLANYTGLAYGPNGTPAVAYDDFANDQIKFASWNGLSWDIEVADSGGPGISLAYDPVAWEPTISHGWGKLYFTGKSGSSWSSEIIESRRANNDVTSLAYFAGEPAISYRTGGRKGGLKVARRSGSVWTTEVVEGAGARYSSLAFDLSGNPAVAYSDDIDGDGWLDTLKFTRWNGSSWDIEIVDTGPVGYGVFATLAFDPAGNPSVAHRGTGQMRFFRWDGSNWVQEEIDNTTQGVNGASLTYAPDGTAYLAFGADYGEGTNMTIARRDPGGTWELETVDFEFNSPFLISVRVAPDDQPSVSYQGPSSMRFAKKGSL